MILVKNLNYKTNSKLSNINLSKNLKVKFSSKKKYMNAGVYLFKKQLINKLKISHSSLENDILPKLIKKN